MATGHCWAGGSATLACVLVTVTVAPVLLLVRPSFAPAGGKQHRR
ncbi:hypothetical protein ACFU53_13360 [Streptomyces sp. NPDC057474]